MTNHKSKDYKETAVNFYLVEDRNIQVVIKHESENQKNTYKNRRFKCAKV
jgi:hypothetical protein